MTAKEKAVALLKRAHEEPETSACSYAANTKLSVFRFIREELIAAGAKIDEKATAAAYSQFMETPSWFGASANAMTDSGVVEEKKRGTKVVPQFKS